MLNHAIYYNMFWFYKLQSCKLFSKHRDRQHSVSTTSINVFAKWVITQATWSRVRDMASGSDVVQGITLYGLTINQQQNPPVSL